MSLLAETISWRRMAMDRSEIIVQQGDVTPSDLDRRRAVAQDALQAEDIAPVCKERPGECVAQYVGRAARLQSRAGSEPVNQLIQPSRGQSVATRTRE